MQFFNGTNFQDAFIIPPHTDNDGQPPDTNYAVIAGTHSQYKNQATVFLNGNLIGSQMFAEDIVNFQDPAEVFTTNNASHFVPGVNVINFTAHNFTDRIALDFKADICFKP